MIEGQYFFHDDLKYDFEKWDYCTTTDRRFYTEIKKGNFITVFAAIYFKN